MPTYRNTSNATYVNTKYNIFGIEPGEEFTIDKILDSPSLTEISDDPEAKYEGDQTLTLNPGDEFVLDLSDKIEVAVYPVNISSGDIVTICINQPCDTLSDENKIHLDSSNYYHEQYLYHKGYTQLYIKGDSGNSSSSVVKLVYKFA